MRARVDYWLLNCRILPWNWVWVGRWTRRLGERRRFREALELIARGGCENYTRDYRCWDSRDRAKDAYFTAEAWCDACIAQEALGRWARKHDRKR